MMSNGFSPGMIIKVLNSLRGKNLKEDIISEATPDPITYGPDKVAKAMAIATKSDGQFSKAVREIEKIGKDLSKVSTIARALKTANENYSGARETFERIYKDKKESMQEARWQIEGQTGYKGISGYDQFSMVINAKNEKDAEDKAYDELEKARDKRKIGPGGGGRLEDTEVESVEKTNDRLSPPETFRGY